MSDVKRLNVVVLGKAASQKEVQETAADMEGWPWFGGMLTCHA
jgi:hypothetical protein